VPAHTLFRYLTSHDSPGAPSVTGSIVTGGNLRGSRPHVFTPPQSRKGPVSTGPDAHPHTAGLQPLRYPAPMGLDVVELILRCEELFAITLADDELTRIRTVGEFYTLNCRELNVIPEANPVTPGTLPAVSVVTKKGWIFDTRSKLPPPEPQVWTPSLVWAYVVAIVVDQQGLKPERIQPHAEIVRDLGIY
jgi:hypothetical protein